MRNLGCGGFQRIVNHKISPCFVVTMNMYESPPFLYNPPTCPTYVEHSPYSHLSVDWEWNIRSVL